MQVLVTPLLYKDMKISAKRLDQTFLSTLEADHPGLPQVRTLCIRPLEPSEYGVGWDYLDQWRAQAVCRLLQTIPRNSLTRFEYDTIYS
jgi:hypothetical protein